MHVRTGLLPTAVTVYDDGVGPEDGGTTVTVADVVEETTAVGVPGALGGASGADVEGTEEDPIVLLAVEVNV